jgi:hypothetical protein
MDLNLTTLPAAAFVLRSAATGCDLGQFASEAQVRAYVAGQTHKHFHAPIRGFEWTFAHDVTVGDVTVELRYP